MKEKSGYGFGTLAVHAGYSPDPFTKSRGVPIYPTAAYAFDNTEHARQLFMLEESGNIYSRINNPTCDILGDRLAALEGGIAGLTLSSGHAAIAMTMLNLCRAGDEVVSARSIYGGAANLFTRTLKNVGITVRMVDSDRPEAFAEATNEKTRAYFVESIGNPRADLPDVQAISKIAKANRVPLIVDNTVATPYLFKPIEHGADIIIHSATKFLTGSGSVLGGVVVDCGTFNWLGNERFPDFNTPDDSYKGLIYAEALGNRAFITKLRTQMLRDYGACLSPFNAWIIMMGIETLPLRMRKHSDNALEVARFLESHPAVGEVCYPSLGGSKYSDMAKRDFPRGCSSVFCFDLRGGRTETAVFCDSLKLLTIVANLGDSKSMVNCPSLTTHSQLSDEELRNICISPSTVRISVGIEEPEDIIDDLKQALDKAIK